MTAALDLGSEEFRSLRGSENRLIARRIPAKYCVIEDNLQHRHLLKQARIPYSIAGESIIVVGDSANEIAGFAGTPLIPVLPSMQFASESLLARQICATLVQTILPPSKRTGEACAICVPAIVSRSHIDVLRNIENTLKLIGYTSHRLSPASALAISELDQRQMTGMAIVIGAESISMSLIDLGRPVFESEFAHGFRRIEEEYAAKFHRYFWNQSGNCYFDVPSIQLWLAESDTDLSSPRTGEEFWLAEKLSDLIRRAWMASLSRLLRVSRDQVFSKELSIVISGGPTRLQGIASLVECVIRQSEFPLRIREIVPSIFTPYAVARGLLIHAELIDSEVESSVSAA